MVKPKLSIVLSTHQAKFDAVALKGDLEENISKIAGWGYSGVELAIRDPSLVDAGQVVDVINKCGLIVPAIGTGQAWFEEGLSFTHPDRTIREAAVARIKSHYPFARRMNALVIIGLIRGVTPHGQTKSTSMEYLHSCLRECLDAAVGQDIRLAIEPLNRYETDLINTVEEGLELIQRLSSTSFGLLLDTFHMNIEEPSIEASIRQASSVILHFHVADSNRWYPGAGHLDFKSVLQSLYNTGYIGWVSGEFKPLPDADSAAQLSIDFLKHTLELIDISKDPES